MRRWRLVAVVAAAAMVGSACWPARGQGPNRTGFNDIETAFTLATVDDIEHLWTFNPLGPSDRQAPTSAVVSIDGGVHVASPSQTGYRLFALDPDTGRVRWSELLDGRGLQSIDRQSPPWVVGDRAGDRVVVSTMRDDINNVDTHHGSTQVFDAATGEDLGHVADGGDLQAVTDGGSGAVVVQDTAPLPTGTSYTMRLGYLTRPSTVDRRIDLALQHPTFRDGLGGVTIGRGQIFHTGAGVMSTSPGSTYQGPGVRSFGSYNPGAVACGPLGTTDVLVECPVWVKPAYIPAGSAPVLDPDRPVVYVAASDGVLALNTETGTEIWRGAGSLGPPTRTPALAHGRLYVGTAFGLAVYDALGCGTPTCAPLWQSAPSPPYDEYPGQAVEQAAVAGGVVFVSTERGHVGRLVAYDAEGCGQAGCQPIWDTDLPGKIIGELAISAGQIYVPTEAGLLAFGIRP